MKAAEEDGSVRFEKEGFQLLVSRGYEQRVTAEGLADAAGFDALMATARRVRGGRGSNRILESSGDPIRLRPSRHGGILGRWLGDRFLSPDRPFREFRLWVELRRRGVVLPTPVLAVSRRRGLLWKCAFGSLDRVGAHDGADWLETQPNAAQLRMACIAFARTLRRLHDAGGLHGDLHLRNILIEDEDDSLQLFLIDLDRTRIVQAPSARERLRELMRFARSLEKNDRADLISPRFRALALSAYCAGDRSLRRSMLGWASVEAQRVRYHRLGWWIRKRLSSTLFAAIILSGLTCSIESLDQKGTGRWSLIATGDMPGTNILADHRPVAASDRERQRGRVALRPSLSIYFDGPGSSIFKRPDFAPTSKSIPWADPRTPSAVES